MSALKVGTYIIENVKILPLFFIILKNIKNSPALGLLNISTSAYDDMAIMYFAVFRVVYMARQHTNCKKYISQSLHDII